MKKIAFILFVIFLYSVKVSAQDFYDIGSIQKIEILFSQSNWDYILDTAKQGKDSYTVVQWVKVNGVQYDSAGVKYKGNSSYSPSRVKNPLHIELNYINDQNYKGYKDIKLSNGFKDPSFVREVLAYDILRKYMHASLSNFAQVYINGSHMGLYANTEAINKTFVASRFLSNNNSFFFCDNFGCGLSYKGPDSTLYNMTYTLKSDYGWSDLINLTNTLRNNINCIENILDVDCALWMLAFDNVLVNLDSYIGQPRHNYYIYEDHNGRFNPIVWDVNEAFGNFVNAGTGSLTIPQMQTLTPTLHINDSLWPLVKKLLAVPMYKRMYIAHMRTIVGENFANNSYYNTGQYLQSIVDTAVQSDPNKFYTYSDFLNNLTTNVTSGPQTLAGITYLMDARTTYLNSTTEFQQIPPTVSNIHPSDTFPAIGSTIFFTAEVINASAVYIGLRYSVMEKFTRMTMYDDGAHGDGVSGDGTYGISIPVISPEMHYYIYAENNNAGIFAPQRAEHEFYTFNASFSTVVAGEVVINEMMAMNASTVKNSIGLYSDWIELYNNTAYYVSLDNLNLSDDAALPAKWPFPSGKVISPHGFLIVWADNDTAISELHCNFKFSANGEHAILAYANGYVVDSISFPDQTADTSWGRYPNGTGAFIFMPPTFNATNTLLPAEKTFVENNGIYIYPNPFSEVTHIAIANYSSSLRYYFIMYNILGSEVKNIPVTSADFILERGNLPAGMYFYQVRDDKQFISSGKLIIQ